MPVGVVTVTGADPAGRGGLVARTAVSESTVNVAAVPPNDTAVAPVSPVPLMSTVVPPATGPELGVRLLTTGAPTGGTGGGATR